MKLEEYIDVEKLQKYIDKKLVNRRQHKTLPLSIYSYGKKAMYDNIWDDVTCRTRGLIVNDVTNEIIARPYEKFFSLDQKPELLEEAEKEEALGNKPVVTEKVNGCLGILWRYGIHWGIATKGSFHSDHAEWATKWLEHHMNKHGPLIFPNGYTPVFEIICQDIQPHVIKYPEDKLVLLSLVFNETGEELPISSFDKNNLIDYANKNKLAIPLPIGSGISLAFYTKHDYPNFEGYVATYNRAGEPPLKIKIKFPTFLKNRQKFYAEKAIKDRALELVEDQPKYDEIHALCANIIKDALVHCTERKEFIEYFSKPENEKYKTICIAMLDTNTKQYQELIWKMVKNGN